MRDPEIQAIMSDPVFQAILQQAQNEPASLQQHMQNPGIRAKIEKLARAVSWRCFVGVEEGADWFETSRVSSRRGEGNGGEGWEGGAEGGVGKGTGEKEERGVCGIWNTFGLKLCFVLQALFV